MNQNETREMKLKYNLCLTLIGPDGKVKEERKYHNLVTTAGKNDAIKQVVGDVGGGVQPSKFNYVGIGTGTTVETANDTVLETEVGTRVQDTDPDFPSTGRGDLIALFPAGNGTGTISEAGVLNASTSGTMLARKTFTGINKGALDALQVTWQITAA